MKMISKSPVAFSTVKLIGRLLTPIVERGVISQPEFNKLMANLGRLPQKGELIPDVLPKLINQKEAAELLGVSFFRFRNLGWDIQSIIHPTALSCLTFSKRVVKLKSVDDS